MRYRLMTGLVIVTSMALEACGVAPDTPVAYARPVSEGKH